jgi:hypothetical protein
VTQLTDKQVKKAQDLDEQIEALEDLHEMTETEIERTVSAFSVEGRELRAQRKNIRYRLYRLRTEKEGLSASGETDDFRQRFENQAGFDGWLNFAVTWDVAFEDPYRIVSRRLSQEEEWNEVLRAKIPIIKDGKLVYPDINVRKRVEAHLRGE